MPLIRPYGLDPHTGQNCYSALASFSLLLKYTTRAKIQRIQVSNTYMMCDIMLPKFISGELIFSTMDDEGRGGNRVDPLLCFARTHATVADPNFTDGCW